MKETEVGGSERIKRENREYRKERGQYRKENRCYRKENERHENRVAELDGRLMQERKLWLSPESGDRFSDTREAHFVHKREMLDDIIANRRKLRPVSSLDCDQFGFVCRRFIEQSKKHPGRPLFSEDDSDDPGNRCKLPYRHVVLMALMRKRGATIQEQLAVFFGIDQSTVCRYLRFADLIFAQILPTASKVSDRIQKTRTIPDLKKLVPNLATIVDGTHMDIQRPSKKEPRKEAYSGKKKSFTLNTQIMTNRDGVIIHRSRPAPGSTHDLRMVREDPPDLGMITRMMKSKRRRPDGERHAVRGPRIRRDQKGLSGGRTQTAPQEEEGRQPYGGAACCQQEDKQQEGYSGAFHRAHQAVQADGRHVRGDRSRV